MLYTTLYCRVPSTPHGLLVNRSLQRLGCNLSRRIKGEVIVLPDFGERSDGMICTRRRNLVRVANWMRDYPAWVWGGLPMRLEAWRGLRWVMSGGGCARRVVGCVECGGDVDTAETGVLR